MNEHYERGLERRRKINQGRPATTEGLELHDINARFIDSDAGATTFSMYLECPLFTGHELMFYPELASALRNIADYPIMQRKYSLECAEERGTALLCKLSQELPAHCETYAKEYQDRSAEVNALIKRLILRRQPISVEALTSSKITISGIEYTLCTDYYNSRHFDIRHIVTHDLFDVAGSDNPRYVDIADYIPFSPFVDVRLRKDYSYKGRPNWINLETLKPATPRDRNAARAVAV